jgi:hypothetical protein
MAEEQAASIQLLRTFAPLDGMKRENLAALARKVSVRTLSRHARGAQRAAPEPAAPRDGARGG